jgi:hypothetical protein
VKIEDFRKRLQFQNVDESNQKVLWLIFTKNYVNYDYSFYTYIFNHWQEKGYRIRVLDKKIENLESDKSMVFIKNSNYQEKIMSDLKKAFPDSNFMIIKDTKIYLKVIDFLSDNAIDTTNYEALVIMNE